VAGSYERGGRSRQIDEAGMKTEARGGQRKKDAWGGGAVMGRAVET